ncbi:hypothetical protein FKP32DRAFT_811759 [Trametes sanguinea]|nr:hypothetical protein FKP32DRAFT_811759 [Trametes sanguinea]
MTLCLWPEALFTLLHPVWTTINCIEVPKCHIEGHNRQDTLIVQAERGVRTDRGSLSTVMGRMHTILHHCSHCVLSGPSMSILTAHCRAASHFVHPEALRHDVTAPSVSLFRAATLSLDLNRWNRSTKQRLCIDRKCRLFEGS